MTDPKVEPDILFAPIEAAVVKAFAVRSGAKALASLRPLIWLAYLALAQAFGLAHLITPEMRAIAIDTARRPGRRKAEPDGQGSLLDLFPMNDGRPGIYVSFARLKLGNVRDVQGDSVLDLTGITELPDALVKAYEQGWIGGPSGNGLRFIPPTVWGLVVDHNSAGFARNGGVDEYIATLQERIALLETSIAESARLPTIAIPDEPCDHKSVTLFDGVRTCNSCKATLPNLSNEKVAKMRKNAHAKLTENEEPREPSLNTTAKVSKSSRVKESLNHKTSKKASKGRAS